MSIGETEENLDKRRERLIETLNKDYGNRTPERIKVLQSLNEKEIVLVEDVLKSRTVATNETDDEKEKGSSAAVRKGIDIVNHTRAKEEVSKLSPSPAAFSSSPSSSPSSSSSSSSFSSSPSPSSSSSFSPAAPSPSLVPASSIFENFEKQKKELIKSIQQKWNSSSSKNDTRVEVVRIISCIDDGSMDKKLEPLILDLNKKETKLDDIITQLSPIAKEISDEKKQKLNDEHPELGGTRSTEHENFIENLYTLFGNSTPAPASSTFHDEPKELEKSKEWLVNQLLDNTSQTSSDVERDKVNKAVDVIFSGNKEEINLVHSMVPSDNTASVDDIIKACGVIIENRKAEAQRATPAPAPAVSESGDPSPSSPSSPALLTIEERKAKIVDKYLEVASSNSTTDKSMVYSNIDKISKFDERHLHVLEGVISVNQANPHLFNVVNKRIEDLSSPPSVTPKGSTIPKFKEIPARLKKEFANAKEQILNPKEQIKKLLGPLGR